MIKTRCPLNLQKCPTQACSLGKESVNQIRQGKEPSCPWYIANAESNFCFCKYMEDRGTGRPVSAAKTSSLLMMNDSEVAEITNEGRKMMIESLDLRGESSTVIDIKDDSGI